MSVLPFFFLSFFICLPTTFAVLGKSKQTIDGWKRLFEGKVISYEPTCSHKQCDRIGEITTHLIYTPYIRVCTQSESAN